VLPLPAILLLPWPAKPPHPTLRRAAPPSGPAERPGRAPPI